MRLTRVFPLFLSRVALTSPQGRKKSRTQPATAITGNGRTYRGFLIKSAAPAWAVSAQTTHRQYRSWKRNWKALKKSQETMKSVNAYYRKHKTLDGCPHLPPEELEKLKADMASSWHLEDKPFATWALSNNSAEIRRVKDRIKSLSQPKRNRFCGLEI